MGEVRLNALTTLSEPSWPPVPADLEFAAGKVHVISASLDVSAATLDGFVSTLSSDETERASHFRFGLLRKRFIAGRGWLRHLLARALDCAAAELEFSYSTAGKPMLDGAFAGFGLHLNLAHSEDQALIAVTRTARIGVDIERVRELTDMDHLVARFFSDRENLAFGKLAAEAKPAAFFNLWTRKEALLKATGAGISGGLNRVEVTFLPEEPVRVLALPDGFGSGKQWLLQHLVPVAGYVGAVAIECPGCEILTWRLV